MNLYSRGVYLNLSSPHVMGILNITPDSFFDGGRNNTITNAINHTAMMINSGASIIDVGGESTKPGSNEVTVEEELDRVIPVIEALSKRFDVWISVDTSKPEVISESVKAGVYMINDIRSLTLPGSLQVAVDSQLPVCIMHMQGNPLTMQNSPYYHNVVEEVDSYLDIQIKRCISAGIKKENLILDVGFGFGKNLNHNYQLLAHFSHFLHFNQPLMVGLSRKSMINQILNTTPFNCLYGSISCAVIAALQGANIIRVHDVKETVEAMCIIKAVKKQMD